MFTDIVGNLAVSLIVAIPIGPSGLTAAPAHEEGDKLEYLADHLSESPILFDPLNLELVDELKLTEDGQLETQIQMPVGVLATSDLFVSGNHAYVGSFADAVTSSTSHDLINCNSWRGSLHPVLQSTSRSMAI